MKIFKKAGAKSSPSTGLVKNLSKRAHPYYKEYKTCVINAVGEEDPWFMPLDGHICDWWNELVGGDKKAHITSKDGDDRAYNDFKEIKQLVRLPQSSAPRLDIHSVDAGQHPLN
jgi:hypothetical protein